MKLSDIKYLTRTNSPASPVDISAVEQTLGLILPDVYKEFLHLCNGAAARFATLYDTVSLIEMNQTYEVQEYAPGYVTIGNDGGGYHLMMLAKIDATEFQLVSDGDGVPSDDDCKDLFTGWLLSDDGNPWRNKP